MNNKIINIPLLAKNAGKLDKIKSNINDRFNKIERVLESLNSYDEGDYKNQRQEFHDKLNEIVSEIDDILLKYIEFIKQLISSEQELESSQASDLAKETEEMKRKSGSGGGSTGGGSGSGGGSIGGGALSPTNTEGSTQQNPQGQGNTNGTGNNQSATDRVFGRNDDGIRRNSIIEDLLSRLRGNSTNNTSNNGTNNTGTGTGSGSTPPNPSDNLGKLSTGGEDAANKVLDDLLKSNTSPDEQQQLNEEDKTLEENLPTLSEGENNPTTDTSSTEDSSLADLSTSTTDDSIPSDSGSSSDWVKYAGLGTLGLGAVGLGAAALMSKNKEEDELSEEETEDTNSDWSTVNVNGDNNESFNTTSSNW